MKIALRYWAAAVVLALNGNLLLAQDTAAEKPADPTVTEWTREKIDNPPRREIKFERMDEPLVAIKFPASMAEVSPDLSPAERQKQFALAIESVRKQTFVAIIRLAPSHGWGWFHNKTSDKVLDLQVFGPTFLLEPGLHSREPERISRSIERYIANIPESRLPSAAELAFFKPPSLVIDLADASKTAKYREIRVHATSAEEAERRATTLLTIMDQGMFRPLQLYFFEQYDPVRKEYELQRAAFKLRPAELELLQAQLKQYEDYSVEMFAGLRLQQLQLDVEATGVQARIAAIERRISQIPDNTNARGRQTREQLEDAKLAAEIELVSLEARRKKSDEFLTKVKAKMDLSRRMAEAQASLDKAKAELEKLPAALKDIEKNLKLFSPPVLVEGKVIIRPWVWPGTAGSPETSGGIF